MTFIYVYLCPTLGDLGQQIWVTTVYQCGEHNFSVIVHTNISYDLTHNKHSV